MQTFIQISYYFSMPIYHLCVSNKHDTKENIKSVAELKLAIAGGKYKANIFAVITELQD